MRHLPGELLKMAVPCGRRSDRVFSAKNRHDLQLLIPSFSYAASDRFPVYGVLRTWNELPETAASLTDFGVFKLTVHSPVIYCMTERFIPDVL